MKGDETCDPDRIERRAGVCVCLLVVSGRRVLPRSSLHPPTHVQSHRSRPLNRGRGPEPGVMEDALERLWTERCCEVTDLH